MKRLRTTMRLDKVIDLWLAECTSADGNAAARKPMRIRSVQRKWEQAIRKVYRGEGVADMVLSHINAVYLMKDDRAAARHDEAALQKLVVYVDDSLVRSDLDARQEFIKMSLASQGERVDAFSILPSKGNMKKRKPFAVVDDEGNRLAHIYDRARRRPLSSDRLASIEERVGTVDNPEIRAAMRKAMVALAEFHPEK